MVAHTSPECDRVIRRFVTSMPFPADVIVTGPRLVVHRL